MHKCIDMLEAAKRTGIKGGRQALMALLRNHGHLVRNRGSNDQTVSQKMIELGYMKNELKQARTCGGIDRNYYKPVVTEKGISWLHDFVKEHGEIKPEQSAA